MKTTLSKHMQRIIHHLYPELNTVDVELENPKQRQHGDYACSIALALAKPLKKAPRKIAEAIVEQFPQLPDLESINLAGPGFINFTLTSHYKNQIIKRITQKESSVLYPKLSDQDPIYLEFVSCNPTGPVHVGHGRAAAIGSSLARILEATGFDVHTEYYINDIGNQMNTLALTLWLHYMNLQGAQFPLPEDAYQGQYMNDLARPFLHDVGSAFVCYPDTSPTTLEEWLNWLIPTLGHDRHRELIDAAYRPILNGIKDDLSAFGVTYCRWFRESDLLTNRTIQTITKMLKDKETLYEHEGALWFRSTQWGDDKDRVLIRANGQHTYFAADVAYHWSKFQEFPGSLVIDLFGADHHGYIARLRAALTALDCPIDRFEVLLVQFATLRRGQEKISMSTRSGSFVSLAELSQEVGTDAARYYYCSRKADQHVDFDLEVAKQQNTSNPVYYIQYAHARIRKIINSTNLPTQANLQALSEQEEANLIHLLSLFSERLKQSALNREPHLLVFYLHDLASHFHKYYTQFPILKASEEIRDARLQLISAVSILLKHGLSLLGINAPETM